MYSKKMLSASVAVAMNSKSIQIVGVSDFIDKIQEETKNKIYNISDIGDGETFLIYTHEEIAKNNGYAIAY